MEIGALNTVFGAKSAPNRQARTTPLYVGSVKTNIGHLEMAAGVAGIMKLALALQQGVIPPHLHLQTPNPHIDWATSPVQVPTVVTPWPYPADGHERMGGVSSFGFSGTNAHLILAETPRTEQRTNNQSLTCTDRTCHLFTISTKTQDTLQIYAQRYVDFLAVHPDLNLGDLCYTSHVGRSHYPHRLGLAASSITELQQQLTRYVATGKAPGLSQGTIHPTQTPPKIAFLFTGQGAQYKKMGRTLYETHATFRATLDRCEAVYQACTGESLLAVLYPPPDTFEQPPQPPTIQEESSATSEHSSVDDTTYTQPALFALEYALATLWQSWGVQPDFLIGHSVGEVAAACVAGVFRLEDGMKLIAA
ncbi:MAG: acyltransferase domain-containing protein, partial [Caldilinea sp.]